MALHISRLVIENLRNFAHLELNRFPSSAVIVGENGIGKTNLLFALRLVLDPNLPDARRQLVASDISEYAQTRLADGVEVRVTVDLAGFDDDVAARSELDGCYISVDPYVARLTYLFRPLAAMPTEDESDEPPRALTVDDYEWLVFGGDSEASDARRVRRIVTFSVLPALRDAEGDLAVQTRSPLPELLDAAGPDLAALERATRSVDRVMTRLAGDPALTSLSEEIGLQITKMVGPQLDLEPTLGFASGRPDQLLKSVRLFVDQPRSRTVADTSTGNANVVYLALLLRRLALRRRTDRRSRVVATLLGVEEPEAHLHPGLQRHLFGYLLREASGLALTTHSPHIAAVAPLDALVLLSRDPTTGGTIAHAAAGAGLTEHESADLERYLDVTRAEILFARVVAFVEGMAETYLMRALAHAAELDLDAYGVVVASVSGTDFGPYRRLCGRRALNIPHIIVTDGDREVGGGFLGLHRAAGLIPSGAARSVKAGVVALRSEARSDREQKERADLNPQGEALPEVASEEELTETVLRFGIYIGSDTLEMDVIPLLSREMTSAFSDLRSNQPKIISRFSDAVSRVASDAENADGDRSLIIRSIERVGKGRFSQRLAGYVAAWPKGELRRRVLELGGLDSQDWEEYDLGDDILVGTGTPSYLLRALEALSRIVRNGPFLPGKVDEQEVLG